MLLRKIEINYQNTTSLVNDLITVTSELENEKESVKRALDELNDLENYHANKGAIVNELEFRKIKIDKDIQNTEELIQNIKDFSERVQETDERLAQKFKQDIKSYAKQNSIELVSDFDKWLDKAQMALDAIGIFPLVGEVADVINGVIYLAKGDIKNAGISFISMIPEVGDTAKSVRYFDKASDLLKLGDKVVDLKKTNKSIKNSKKMLDEAHNVVQYAKYKEVLKTTEKANPLVESLINTGGLPSNYITKSQAKINGWKPGKALDNYVKGAQIGGDVFKNTTGILPKAKGRIWCEADIGMNNLMSRAKQPGRRLLYSNDGLLYITYDHYKTVHKIGKWK